MGSLEIFEGFLVVLKLCSQVKACPAELGQRLFGTGHPTEVVAHLVPLHGYRLQDSLVSLLNPSCFSYISSLQYQLHRILAKLPGDMLLSYTAFFDLLDLSSFLLYLQV